MYDDDTQEIDMSKLLGTPPANVVRVDFKKVATPPSIRWLTRFDVHSSWIVRFLAVMIVLLLSLLMI